MPDRMGPLRKSRFAINIEGGPAKDITGFSLVELPKMEVQAGKYREGSDPQFDKQLWGITNYKNLTFERGTRSGEKALAEWYDMVRAGKMERARTSVTIKLLDEQGQPQVRWTITEAWPVDYQPPSMDANTSGGEGAIAKETITVTYHGYRKNV